MVTSNQVNKAHRWCPAAASCLVEPVTRGLRNAEECWNIDADDELVGSVSSSHRCEGVNLWTCEEVKLNTVIKDGVSWNTNCVSRTEADRNIYTHQYFLIIRRLECWWFTGSLWSRTIRLPPDPSHTNSIIQMYNTMQPRIKRSANHGHLLYERLFIYDTELTSLLQK